MFFSPDGTVTFKINASWIDINPIFKITTTHYPDGSKVYAIPKHTEEDTERSKSIGYGNDVGRMSYEHEVLHTIVAKLQGLDYSPTLYGVAHNKVYPDFVREECIVLAYQRYLNDGEYDNYLEYIPDYSKHAKSVKKLLRRIYDRNN
jgi:hypothetical protein